jgi:hypothetical protein
MKPKPFPSQLIPDNAQLLSSGYSARIAAIMQARGKCRNLKSENHFNARMNRKGKTLQTM